MTLQSVTPELPAHARALLIGGAVFYDLKNRQIRAVPVCAI